MANITELQLQGDSTIHKLNDARITTTAVSTATHFLATDSSISSIAPITAANLASVLGGLKAVNWGTHVNPDNLKATGYGYIEIEQQYSPSGTYRGWYILVLAGDGFTQQFLFYDNADNAVSYYYWRRAVGNIWSDWVKIDSNIPSFYKNYNDLTALATALKAIW